MHQRLEGTNVKPRDANIVNQQEFMEWCQVGNFAGMEM
jgi:hypothetical protein